MRTLSLWLSMTVFLGTATTAFGQASFLTFAKVSVRAEELSGDQSKVLDEDEDRGESLSSAEAAADVLSEGTDGGIPKTKQLSISGAAHVGIASLGVSLKGNIEAGDGSIFLGLGGEVQGISSAFWKDTMTVFDPSRGTGEPLVIKTKLALSGNLVTIASSLPERKECDRCIPLPENRGLSEVTLFLNDFSTLTLDFFEDDDTQQIGTSLSSLIASDIEIPPSLIEVNHLVTNGQPYTIGFGLSVVGLARAPFNMTAIFDADYSRTLNWGGIQSVKDAVTGEEIHGWTVTSASGFDYSKPIGVPEPASILLLVTALSAGLTLGRRRRGRVGLK